MAKIKTDKRELNMVDATIVPILDESGEIVEYAGIRHDITELVTKTQELSDMKDKQRFQDIQKALSIHMEDILESIPFASIFVEDSSSKIISSNKSFNSLFSSHPCFVGEECSLEKLFVQEEPYLLSSETFSFYDSYSISDEDERVVGILNNGMLQEFWIGATQKKEGFILSLVEKKQ